MIATTDVIGKSEQQMHKASYCGSKQQYKSPDKITLLLLVRTTYIWVLIFVHILFVVNRTFNATPIKRLQQHPLLFTTNRTDRTFLLRRLYLVWPSYPGYSTILLRSESPSDKCTKLHTMAASNNKDHLTRSLYYCLFAPHIYGCCSSRTLFMVNCTFNATPTERLQHHKHWRLKSCYKYILISLYHLPNISLVLYFFVYPWQLKKQTCATLFSNATKL